MKKRSTDIAKDNSKLYEQMRQNVLYKELPVTDDSDIEDDEYVEILNQSKERLLRTKAECENDVGKNFYGW